MNGRVGWRRISIELMCSYVLAAAVADEGTLDVQAHGLQREYSASKCTHEGKT